MDTNILVYASRAELPEHKAAARTIRALAEASAPWAIPWPCLHEFLCVTTNPRIFRPPTPIPIALRQVEYLRESPSLHFLGEGSGHWDRLQALVRGGHLAGPIIHDARVAAICLEHGVEELWTADRDFSRMRGLKLRNPLLEA